MPRKKKNLYIAVMLLGAAALVVDRCVLSQSKTLPAPATASVSRPAAESRVTATPPSVEMLSTLELPFPRTIPSWNPQIPIRDLFAPQSDDGAADKLLTRSLRDPRTGSGTCAGLVVRRRLEAVLVQDSLRIAILDGAWVRIGEAVDGCVLTEITGHKVRFRCRDGDTVLTLSPRGLK